MAFLFSGIFLSIILQFQIVCRPYTCYMAVVIQSNGRKNILLFSSARTCVKPSVG